MRRFLSVAVLLLPLIAFWGCASEEGGGGGGGGEPTAAGPHRIDACVILLPDSAQALAFGGCYEEISESYWEVPSEYSFTVNGVELADPCEMHWTSWLLEGRLSLAPGDMVVFTAEADGHTYTDSTTVPDCDVTAMFFCDLPDPEPIGDTLVSNDITVNWNVEGDLPNGIYITCFSPESPMQGIMESGAYLDLEDASGSEFFDWDGSGPHTIRLCATNYTKFNDDLDESYWSEDFNALVVQRCFDFHVFLGVRVWVEGDTIFWSPQYAMKELEVSDGSTTLWRITSEGGFESPVVYGVVPEGAVQEVPSSGDPQPLAEGTQYTVTVEDRANDVEGEVEFEYGG